MIISAAREPDESYSFDPLYELTLTVAAARHPQEIFEAALDCLRDSIGVARSSVLIFDSDRIMRFRAARGLSDAYQAAVEGHSPWTADTLDAAPILVAHVRTEPSLAALADVIEAEGIRALAFIPLTLGSRLLGKFMLYYDTPHAFHDEEILVAKTIAAHVAFAIDQQEHRETERRFRQLVDGLGVAVYTTDAAGLIRSYNAAAVELWGRTPAIGEDTSSGAWRLYAPDGVPLARDAYPMARALRDRRAGTGEDALLERPDGSRVPFTVFPTPLFDAAGELDGAVNVMIDISARKDAERALSEAEARAHAHDYYLAAATARLVSPIASTDMLAEIARLALPALADVCSIGLFDGTSQTARVETAITDETVRGHVGAIHLRGWKIAPEATLTIGQAIANGQPIFVPDFSDAWIDACAPDDIQQTEARAVRGCSLICVPLLARGAPIGMATFATTRRSGRRYTEKDLLLFGEIASRLSIAIENVRLYDDLRAKADELERSNVAKDEFLGLVSHELRTPLTTIRGNAEVLTRRFEQIDRESQLDALTDIAVESERLQAIIDNLLLLARLEQGQEPEREPVLVARVAERVIERHRRRDPARQFEIVASEQPRPVNFPEGYLDQVIENLVSNAEKYSPRNQAIVVEITRTEAQVRVAVLDRGIGVGEQAGDLFEPFYRAGEARQRTGGLGIGLAVCRRLVEAQGGAIWARPREGGGSEFGFHLPIIADDEP